MSDRGAIHDLLRQIKEAIDDFRAELRAEAVAQKERIEDLETLVDEQGKEIQALKEGQRKWLNLWEDSMATPNDADF